MDLPKVWAVVNLLADKLCRVASISGSKVAAIILDVIPENELKQLYADGCPSSEILRQESA
jgi:hypothetical protein